MQRIEYVLNRAEGPTILDLGAVQHDLEKTRKNEWLHDYLVRNFKRVIGVDILGKEIETLNKQGYEMVQADVTNMELSIEADTIVAGELIEHLSNPGLMLENIDSHLKPSGKLILTTPNPWVFGHIRRWITDTMQVNEEHTAWFGPIVLEQLLSRYKFEVIDTTFCGPDHGGVSGVFQKLGIDKMGYSSICITAKKAEIED